MTRPAVAEGWQSELVVEHARAGYTVAEIAVLVFGSAGHRDRRLVERTLLAADTYIDEVALARAACGDVLVYRALTPTERREFVRRVEAGFRDEREACGLPQTGRTAGLESKRALLDALGVSESHWREMVRDYWTEV